MYELTGSPLDLGLVGLVQFLPGLLLLFVVGSGGRPSRSPADPGRLPRAAGDRRR
jgi:hypothetical protein